MYGTNGIKCVIIALTFMALAVYLTGCEKSEEEAQSFTTEETSEEDSSQLSEEGDDSGEQSHSGEWDAAETDTIIYVDVRGQVNSPGVYALSSDSRVFEVIEKAGGMTKEAAVSYVNQAERLTDGQQIYVPSEKEVQDAALSGTGKGVVPGGAGGADSSAGGQSGKVNLNTATKEELMTLNGIGEAKAEAIIKYREEYGSFSSVEEIMKIEGIKEGIFNKVKEQITV